MAEAAAAPAATPAPAPSVHERLKAFLTPPEPTPAKAEGEKVEEEASSGVVKPPQKKAEAVPNEKVEGDDAETESKDLPEDEPEDDAQSEEVQLSTLSELADATGYELEKMLDLALPVKIDGKEGTARLRDLVKSYQLDGHINQKLASLDTDRKALDAKRQEHERVAADRLLKLDAGVKTLERALMGQFASVDWQKLQAENPAEFNSQYVAYQQHYAQMQDIARQIAAEQQQAQAQQTEQAKAWLEEQRTLLTSKIPEWADATRRGKDKAEIVEYLKGYGISREEFEALGDHRHAMVVRDAWKWSQLQKSKPATLNKVKAAPKLLKPGTPQSRTAKANLQMQADQKRLRSTGKVRDASPVLRKLLFQS